MPKLSQTAQPFVRSTAKNGMVYGKYNITKKDGTPGVAVRILKQEPGVGQRIAANAHAKRSAEAAARTPITQAQAQAAFDRFYARTQKMTNAASEKVPIYASPRGRRSARTYDLNHTLSNPAKVINDRRYISRPDLYDFAGVDTGAKQRKALSANQRAVLARGQRALHQFGGSIDPVRPQVAGFWW